jgi:hypothetical protein
MFVVAFPSSSFVFKLVMVCIMCPTPFTTCPLSPPHPSHFGNQIDHTMVNLIHIKSNHNYFSLAMDFFFPLFALPKNMKASSTQFTAFTTSSWLLGLPHLLHSSPKVFLSTGPSSISTFCFRSFFFLCQQPPSFFLLRVPPLFQHFVFQVSFSFDNLEWLVFTSWWYFKPGFGKKVHISV